MFSLLVQWNGKEKSHNHKINRVYDWIAIYFLIYPNTGLLEISIFATDPSSVSVTALRRLFIEHTSATTDPIYDKYTIQTLHVTKLFPNLGTSLIRNIATQAIEYFPTRL